MKTISKELKIGITAVVAIIIIYAGIILLKGLDLFDNSSEYTVVMDDVSGIAISSDVLANGLKVGYVKTIEYNPQKQNMRLKLSVDPNFRIPAGTTVYVSKEMLGAARLNLALGSPDSPIISSSDTIYGQAATDLMAAAAGMLPQVEQMLPKLDSILSSLNRLTADPSLPATMHNIEHTTANLRTTTERLNRMLANDVPQLLGKANNMLANTETITANLSRVDIAAIADNANSTLLNANAIADKINTSLRSKDNSLGLLLNDNSTVLRLDTTLQNASRLLEDLRLHPKRYVHFSVFGKKEKPAQ